jgi:hypothetical protein
LFCEEVKPNLRFVKGKNLFLEEAFGIWVYEQENSKDYAESVDLLKRLACPLSVLCYQSRLFLQLRE